MRAVPRDQHPPAILVGDVADRAAQQPLTRRGERRSVDRRESQLEHERRRRGPPVATAVGEQARMPGAKPDIALCVTSRGAGETSTALHAVVRGDLRNPDALPPALRESHPKVPVLVTARQLPAAHLDQRRAPIETAQRKVVLIRDLPRIQAVSSSITAVLDLPEAPYRSPRCGRLGWRSRTSFSRLRPPAATRSSASSAKT
jgi:hypothetical protein